MIYYITPNRHPLFKKELLRFFLCRHLHEHEKFESTSLYDEKDTSNTTYITYTDSHFGLCGGLRIVPLATPPASSLLPTSLSNHTWECSSFFIELPKALAAYEDYYNKIVHELLKGLIHYGFINDIKLFSTLFACESHQKLLQNKWPFINSEKPLLLNNKWHIPSFLQIL